MDITKFVGGFHSSMTKTLPLLGVLPLIVELHHADWFSSFWTYVGCQGTWNCMVLPVWARSYYVHKGLECKHADFSIDYNYVVTNGIIHAFLVWFLSSEFVDFIRIFQVKTTLKAEMFVERKFCRQKLWWEKICGQKNVLVIKVFGVLFVVRH